MIDIEKLKQAALISNGEPMLISASEVLDLITRLEAAESQLVAQEIHIQQLRDALYNHQEGTRPIYQTVKALAIPASTEHLEAWYREMVGEPVAWGNFKDNGEACLLSISQHPEDRANWMNPKQLHAIKPFKGE